jgi:hypothetical protein
MRWLLRTVLCWLDQHDFGRPLHDCQLGETYTCNHCGAKGHYEADPGGVNAAIWVPEPTADRPDSH